MTGQVVVLGGAGAVGRQVSRHLVRLGHHVVVAGRNKATIQAVVSDLPEATARVVDFTGADGPTDAGSPGIAINCTGIESAESVEHWREHGWGFVDITASSTFAAQLAAAPSDGPALVFGVGLIPGLTGLMCSEIMARQPQTSSITASCLLGLAEEYGNAAQDWTYAQLGREVEGSRGTFRNFSEPAAVDFPGGFGRRMAWRFDFADRVLLPPHLGVEIETRLCFDSRLAGRALAAASALPRVLGALRTISPATRRSIGRSTWWAATLETNDGPAGWAIGDNQSAGTGLMVALIVDQMGNHRLEGPTQPFQFTTLEQLTPELHSQGIHTQLLEGLTSSNPSDTSPAGPPNGTAQDPARRADRPRK